MELTIFQRRTLNAASADGGYVPQNKMASQRARGLVNAGLLCLLGTAYYLTDAGRAALGQVTP